MYYAQIPYRPLISSACFSVDFVILLVDHPVTQKPCEFCFSFPVPWFYRPLPFPTTLTEPSMTTVTLNSAGSDILASFLKGAVADVMDTPSLLLASLRIMVGGWRDG